MSNAFVNCRGCGAVNDSRNTICRTCGYQLKPPTMVLPNDMTTDTPAAAPITAERLREALTLAREYVLSATYRPDSNNFIRSEASRRLAIIDAALSAPAAAPPFTIQPWPPGTSMLQVAVAPNAAAGPYPTAMRPATAEEVAAMRQRFAPSVAAQPAASGVSALWVEEAEQLADNAINAHATWFAERVLGELSNFHMHRLNSAKDAARAALRAHLSTALTGAAKDTK